MSRRAADALRRLGAPHCRRCKRLGGALSYERLCARCVQLEREEKLREHTERMRQIQDRTAGMIARIDAVYDADRPSSSSYRQACAEMEEDVAVSVQGWRFGFGL